MDPKTTANLDPKLKDMYNRVMSAPVPPPVTPPPGNSVPSTQGEPAQASVPQPPLTPTQVPAPIPPQTPLPPPIPPQPTTELHTTIPLPVPPKPISAAVVAGSGKNKGLSFLPILLTTGGTIFFGAYTFFWVKFFKLSIPFLPF